MEDPFDRRWWPLPPLAIELDDLACSLRPADGTIPPRAVDWAVDRLEGGTTPVELIEAAVWVGLRRGRAEGRGPAGLVTHATLAAHACATAGAGIPGDEGERITAMAAVQHVAYTLGAYRGGVNDAREGPSMLGWYAPHEADGDPIEEFLAASANGECELADHWWLHASANDMDSAVHALVRAAAAGYHLNEHKLVYPAQLLAWLGRDHPHASTVLRAAVRYAGNHLQDDSHAESRRADAAALALDAEDRWASDADGSGDLERISVVATGIARTPRRELGPLVLGSLSEGLHPADLVHAISLVHASRFSATPFTLGAPVGAIHASTGTNAVRRCMAATTGRELHYELALCSTESPNARQLMRIEELAVPPSDDAAIEDLLDALHDGNPDAASDAATAIPVDDEQSTTRAWSAVMRTAATDQWMLLHGVKHAVALREDFDSSKHPARIWYLAAAARSAAHATVRRDQDVARRVEERLFGG